MIHVSLTRATWSWNRTRYQKLPQPRYFSISNPSEILIWRHCEANGKEVNSGQFGRYHHHRHRRFHAAWSKHAHGLRLGVLFWNMFTISISFTTMICGRNTPPMENFESCNPGGILPDNPTLLILPQTGQMRYCSCFKISFASRGLCPSVASRLLWRGGRGERSQRWRRESLCCRLPRRRMIGRVHFIRN